jgi:drug/metabolite transporter (DMT)-like permease
VRGRPAPTQSAARRATGCDDLCVIAILGGLGAAVAWATSTLCSSRSSCLVEPITVVAWVMLVGLVIVAPAAAVQGIPSGLDASSGAWLLISGGGNVIGLVLAYAAFRIADVALMAPLVSTEGAVAALIAVAAGETLGPATAATLAVIAAGIFLAALSNSATTEHEVRQASRSLALAGGAALVFGVSLYATARAGSRLPVAWVVLAARLIGVIALALPLAILGRMRLPRRALALVIVSGVCEVLGFYAYTLGSRHGIAVAAVLSSQFATLAAVGGYFLFGERLGRVQTGGVIIVVIGVAVLSLLQA